jgi:hypothetical protein
MLVFKVRFQLWFSYVDLSLKCVDLVLFDFYVLLCWAWWHLFIITPLFFLAARIVLYCIVLVFSQKFFEWEAFPQIKFGDASLGIPVWFHSFNMACPGVSIICNII